MFKSKKNTEPTNTVIGEGVKLESIGLTGSGTVRIDGEYTGDIDLDGSLILGETGKIVGNVSIQDALVAGRLEGNIKCRTTVHISGSAAIYGNIEASALVIDEGAVFNGSCNMHSNASVALVSNKSSGKKESHVKELDHNKELDHTKELEGEMV